MSDETKAPREAVLEEVIYEEAVREHGRPDVTGALAALDAADPIRQLWPEVLEAADAVVSRKHKTPGAYDRASDRLRALLTRARAVAPTEAPNA